MISSLLSSTCHKVKHVNEEVNEELKEVAWFIHVVTELGITVDLMLPTTILIQTPVLHLMARLMCELRLLSDWCGVMENPLALWIISNLRLINGALRKTASQRETARGGKTRFINSVLMFLVQLWNNMFDNLTALRDLETSLKSAYFLWKQCRKKKRMMWHVVSFSWELKLASRF